MHVVPCFGLILSRLKIMRYEACASAKTEFKECSVWGCRQNKTQKIGHRCTQLSLELTCLPCCLLAYGGPSLVRFNLRGKRGNVGGSSARGGWIWFPHRLLVTRLLERAKINISAGFGLQNINTQSGFKLNSYGVLILERLTCSKMTEDKNWKSH